MHYDLEARPRTVRSLWCFTGCTVSMQKPKNTTDNKPKLESSPFGVEGLGESRQQDYIFCRLH